MGPSLAPNFPPNTVLPDPILELHDSNGDLMEINDDWINSPEMTEIIATGLPPGDSKESAILFTPAPGPYTAIVTGTLANPEGIALVEAYKVGPSPP
jgi:hypothetical protein